MRKFGINVDCLHLSFEYELNTLKLIKDAGFNGVFTCTYTTPEVQKLKTRADELGLEFYFLHAPWKNINSMWIDGDDYLEIYNKIKTTIDSANVCGIKIVILHGSSTYNPPKFNSLGFARFDELVYYAKEKGVKIAFENLRTDFTLYEILEHYKNEDYVGFCYDCGHEFCFTGGKSLYLPNLADKTIATHIHDNFGKDFIGKNKEEDLHYLPFDGTLDFNTVMKDIKSVNKNVPLTLEINYNSKKDYSKLSPAKFIEIAYERMQKINNL